MLKLVLFCGDQTISVIALLMPPKALLVLTPVPRR